MLTSLESASGVEWSGRVEFFRSIGSGVVLIMLVYYDMALAVAGYLRRLTIR